MLLKNAFFGLLGGGGTLEVSIIDTGGHLDAGDVDLGRSGNDGRLARSSHWDTIDLVWASDQQQSGGELLQENNAFTAVNTGE